MTIKDAIATSSRLYLKGIRLTDDDSKDRKQVFQRAVIQLFRPYGQVEEVFVRDRFADYAFVAMATTEQAQQVLWKTSTPNNLFDEIHPASDFQTKPNEKRSAKKESLQMQQIQKLHSFAESANLILQCNKSHLERVEEILLSQCQPSQFVKIHGSTCYNIVALIFCQCPSPQAIVHWLDSIWYIQPVIQRSFVILPNIHAGTFSQQSPTFCECTDVPNASVVMDALGDITHKQIKLNTYPPKLQIQLAPILKETPIQWNPQFPTHILSILQLVAPTWQQPGLYCIGTCDYVPVQSSASPKVSVDSCSRAYYKLKEALERYSGTLHRLPSASAIDVGASPGGWTQYLLEHCHCNLVYSIDPGIMDPRVWAWNDADPDLTAHDATDRPMMKHIVKKFQDGLPEVAKLRGNEPVHWYVSDMCVKTMSEQIDALLLAVELGLVNTATFIILTIKCTRGHSKSTFNHLVLEQVNRVASHMDQLQILHLFANRYSERTVMGFWK